MSARHHSNVTLVSLHSAVCPQDVHREAMREAQNIARRDGPRLDRMGSGPRGGK
jgi:hypothetical protein